MVMRFHSASLGLGQNTPTQAASPGPAEAALFGLGCTESRALAARTWTRRDKRLRGRFSGSVGPVSTCESGGLGV